MTIEWNLIIRCQGATTTLVSLYGSQSAMEARANLALVWGDAVEYVGPKLGVVGVVSEKKNFASLSDLKDNLKRSRNRNNNQENFQ